MDKKTVIAVVLSGAILIAYYGFLYKPSKAPVAQQPSQQATPVPQGEAPAPISPEAQTKQGTTQAPSVPKKPGVQTQVQTSFIDTTLSSKNGFSINWLLKKFFKEADNKGPNIDLLIGDENHLPMSLLLLSGQSPLYPFYEGKRESETVQVYTAQHEDLFLTQRLTFGAKDYSIEVDLSVENRGESAQTLTPGIRVSTQQIKEVKRGFLNMGGPPNNVHPLYRMGTKVTREQKLDKLGSYQEVVGDISWAGLEDRYFLRAIIARSMSSQNKASFGKKDGRVFADLRYGPDTLPAGGKKNYQFNVFLGPKDPNFLNQFAGAQLGKAIDHGWFAFVAYPILICMKFFYSFLGNWALAIILLTIIIKILLYPLTKKSMASMKSMQKLQPQLKKIREKYKDDRERLNQETMSLFKTHKVNPMGGCLPMLIQMPIYIALYKVLYNSTELYHAPFFWFYRDLSAPDPYYILPILLGIAMALQQKMTPSTGDPAQAKMMMIMPVLFTVFMLFLPVGLVLYIFVNTVMTVIQQYMHQHDITMMSLLKGKKAKTA